MAKKILFNSSDEIVTKYAEKDIHGDDIDVGELTAAINNKKLYSHTITLKQDGGSKYFHLQKLYSTQKSSAITTVQGLAELLNVGANASDNLYCRAVLYGMSKAEFAKSLEVLSSNGWSIDIPALLTITSILLASSLLKLIPCSNAILLKSSILILLIIYLLHCRFWKKI